MGFTECLECDGLPSGSGDVRSEHDEGAEGEPSAIIVIGSLGTVLDSGPLGGGEGRPQVALDSP